MKYENKLKYTGSLDVLFETLESILSDLSFDLKPKDAKIDVSKQTKKSFSHEERISKVYDRIPKDDSANTDNKTLTVIRFYLSSLLKIQELTQKKQDKQQELISISLYDLKIFNALVSYLVIDGIQPCFPRGVGVPIGLRTKQFSLTASHNDGPQTVNLTPESLTILNEVLTTLTKVFSIKGDVRDLLLLGPYTVDFLSAAAVIAFNTSLPKDLRATGITHYNFIQKQIDSYSLYLHLTSLIRPKTPAWFIAGISHSLAIIPLQRSDGVKALLEFVSGAREKDDIQLADLDRATKILKSIPRNVPIDVYSTKIGTQLLRIVASPTGNLVIPTLQVISELYSERPEIIDLGLKKVVQERVNPLVASPGKADEVLISQNDLEEALVCLYLIVTKSHSVDLSTSFTDSLFLPLWSLLCYLTSAKKKSDLVTSLLVSILQNSENKTEIYVKLMSENLLIRHYAKYWKFSSSSDGGAEIRYSTENEDMDDLIDSFNNTTISENNVTQLFEAIEVRVKKFVDILDLLQDSDISTYFVSLLREWMLFNDNTDEQDPFRALTAIKILEGIIDKSKKKLLGSPDDIVEVVKTALENYANTITSKKSPQTNKIGERTIENLVTLEPDSDDEDGAAEGDSDDEDDNGNTHNDDSEKTQVIQLCFSLISSILMELDVSENTNKASTIKNLMNLVPVLTDIYNFSTSSQIRSLAKSTSAKVSLLKSEGSDNRSEAPSEKSSRHSFIQAIQLMEDPSPPIQAHGMHLLKTLVESLDKSVEFRLALNLYVSKLKDKDSFIYLNAIKGLEALASRYKFKVVNQLLDTYVDVQGDFDVRLRIGEVILKFIENHGQVLDNEQSSKLLDTLISVVSRRQGKEEDNDLVRMSAMSILGQFFEVAPAVATSRLGDCLDCAVQILLLETGEDKSIMRRSAIAMLASIVKSGGNVLKLSSEQLKQIRLRLSVASGDPDALVRAQALTTSEIIDDFTLDIGL